MYKIYDYMYTYTAHFITAFLHEIEPFTTLLYQWFMVTFKLLLVWTAIQDDVQSEHTGLAWTWYLRWTTQQLNRRI